MVFNISKPVKYMPKMAQNIYTVYLRVIVALDFKHFFVEKDVTLYAKIYRYISLYKN